MATQRFDLEATGQQRKLMGVTSNGEERGERYCEGNAAIIKERRDAKGLKTTTMAVHLNINERTYCRWEAGDTPLSEDKLRKVLTALDADEKDLQDFITKFVPANTLVDEEKKSSSAEVVGISWQKIPRLWAGIVFGTLCLVGMAIWMWPTRGKVFISYPKNGTKVPRSVTVSGKCYGLKRGQTIWIYVYAPDETKKGTYYPKKALMATEGNAETFSQSVLVGSASSKDSGANFQIGVLIADEHDQEKLTAETERGGALPSDWKYSMSTILVKRE